MQSFNQLVAQIIKHQVPKNTELAAYFKNDRPAFWAKFNSSLRFTHGKPFLAQARIEQVDFNRIEIYLLAHAYVNTIGPGIEPFDRIYEQTLLRYLDQGLVFDVDTSLLDRE